MLICRGSVIIYGLVCLSHAAVVDEYYPVLSDSVVVVNVEFKENGKLLWTYYIE